MKEKYRWYCLKCNEFFSSLGNEFDCPLCGSHNILFIKILK